MLRIHQIRSAAEAKSYYAQTDYYGQELVGNWGGKAAERLGLDGPVTLEAFGRLCDNLDPASGEQLTVRQKSNRTVGYDFNFNAPKGVSLLYALTGDERGCSPPSVRPWARPCASWRRRRRRASARTAITRIA